MTVAWDNGKRFGLASHAGVAGGLGWGQIAAGPSLLVGCPALSADDACNPS
ncbi:MAG: hypothetical protein WDO74_13650 [Pseudomonadota bacterium]